MKLLLGAFTIVIILFLEPAKAKDLKTKCSDDEMAKFDQIGARVISLSEHQRDFPEVKSKVPQFCR